MVLVLLSSLLPTLPPTPALPPISPLRVPAVDSREKGGVRVDRNRVPGRLSGAAPAAWRQRVGIVLVDSFFYYYYYRMIKATFAASWFVHGCHDRLPDSRCRTATDVPTCVRWQRSIFHRKRLSVKSSSGAEMRFLMQQRLVVHPKHFQYPVIHFQLFHRRSSTTVRSVVNLSPSFRSVPCLTIRGRTTRPTPTGGGGKKKNK